MIKSLKKRGFWKKFFRFFAFLCLAVVCLLLALYIFLQYFFPNEKVKQIAIKTVESSLDRHLTIEKLELAPFGGFDISGIQLRTVSDSAMHDEFPVKNARISRAILKYKLLDLFKKRITINKIHVDSLYLDLKVVPGTQPPTRNAQKIDTVRTDMLAELFLPVTVDLKSLRLENIDVNFQMQDSTSYTAVTLGGVNFLIDDLKVSKGNLLDSTAVIQTDLELFTHPTDFQLVQKDTTGHNIKITGNLLFRLDFEIDGLDRIKTKVRTHVKNLSLVDTQQKLQIPAHLFVNIDMAADYLAKSIHLEPISVKVDENEWISAGATVNQFDTRPIFDFEIKKGVVPLQQLFELAMAVLPDSPDIPVSHLNPNAAINFTSSKVSGATSAEQQDGRLDYNILLDIKNVDLQALDEQLFLDNLNISMQASGSSHQSFNTFINLTYDSVYFALDSIDLYTGFCELDINSIFSPEFVPLDNKLVLSIQNILGAHLDGHVHFTGIKSVQSLTGIAEFNLREINTESFPQIPVKTQGDLSLGIQLATLDSIVFTTNFTTTPLLYVVQDEIEMLPPVDLDVNVFCQTDSALDHFKVKSFDLWLNDIVEMKAHAHLRQFKKVSAELEHLVVHHESVLPFIPGEIKKDFQNLKVSGSTILTANMQADVSENLYYDLSAQLKTENTNIDYPDQLLFLSGVNLDIQADSHFDESTRVDFDLVIDTTEAGFTSSGLFLNNRFGFEIELIGRERLLLKKGQLSVPAFNGRGSFHGKATGFEDKLNGQFVLNFVQNVVDTMRLSPGVFVRGRSEINLNCFTDSRFFDVYANIATKNLDIFAGDDIQISQMNSNIYFKQQYDMENEKFLGLSSSPLPTPSEGVIDYMVYRPYFVNTLQDMSVLEIKQIDAAGYRAENIAIEMYLGEGRIELPKLYTDVYGGNINGRVSVDLAGGDLSKAGFQISSHFSGINSALLTPEDERKHTKGVLNGSMHLNGTGLDPEQNVNVEGFINFTEIEPRVADNILRSMDPEEIDASIKSTRRLIKLGAKPKLLTFRLQHGFFYPSITLAQPFWFPVKISGKSISLARLSVEFLLQMSRQLSVEGG